MKKTLDKQEILNYNKDVPREVREPKQPLIGNQKLTLISSSYESDRKKKSLDNK